MYCSRNGDSFDVMDEHQKAMTSKRGSPENLESRDGNTKTDNSDE